MATYIALIDYTDQGIRSIKDSPARAAAFEDLASGLGVTVKDVYWTTGEHDGVVVFDASDEATAAALMLSLARLGNVRTRMLRAFGREEMQSILDKAR